MSRLFRRIRLLDDRHPPDDALLLSIEGEFEARKQRQVSAHLEGCWQCRRRLERLEGAIGAYVDYLNAPESFAPAPREWAGFEARLRQAAAEPARRRLSWSFPGLSVRYAAMAVAMLVVALWIYNGSVGTMSATQLLSRAEAATRSRMLSVTGPVIHQQLRVRRTSRRVRSEQAATAEVWVDPGQARFRRVGEGDVWGELDRVLRSNGMDPQEPLSASACRRWRHSIALAGERVEAVRLQDGSKGWELATRAAGPHAPGQVIEDTLVISDRSWRPVENRLSVAAAGDVFEYQVTELAYDVQPRDEVASVFKTPPLNPVPAIPPPAVLAPAPPVGDLDAAEAEVRYTLHVLGLCRTGAVDMSREASGLTVQGILSGAERDQLLALLPKFGSVRVEVRTPSEALTQDSGRSVSEPEISAPVELEMPARKSLAAYFRAKVPPDQVGSQVTALTSQSVSLAEEIATEGQALRALLDAYPPERRKTLGAASAKLLTTMIEEHASAFDRLADRQRTLLADVLDTIGGTAGSGEPPAAGVADLLSAAVEAERLTISLFTQTNDPPASVEAAAARLRKLLAELARQPGMMMTAVRDSMVVMSIPQKEGGPNQ